MIDRRREVVLGQSVPQRPDDMGKVVSAPPSQRERERERDRDRERARERARERESERGIDGERETGTSGNAKFVKS